MLYQPGDYVQWTAMVRGNTYKRAGIVLVAVPRGENPMKYVPSGYTLHIRGKPRDTVSYLIQIPGYKTLYFPSVENLFPLSMEDWDLLYSQHIYTKPRKLSNIKQKDRQTMKALADLFGDVYYENIKMLTIPAWGKRFMFKIINGVEVIYEIEQFVPAVRGKERDFNN